MTYYVRMLQRQKWCITKNGCTEEFQSPGNISADPITADLRTSSNNLSIWKISDLNEENLNHCILALATARQKIERMDIIAISETELEKNGFVVKHSPDHAKTAYKDFKENHYDIVELDYNKLGTFAQIIVGHVGDLTEDTEICKRIPLGDIKKILRDGYVKGLYKIDDADNAIKLDLTQLVS